MTPQRQRVIEAERAITWPTGNRGDMAAWREYWAARRAFREHMRHVRHHVTRRQRGGRS